MMPLVEFLLLLLLLLRGALLHWRSLPYQGMRFLWSGVLLLLRLTKVTVGRPHAIHRPLRISVLRLRVLVPGVPAPLPLIGPRLGLRKLTNLVIAAVWRTKRAEAVLTALRPSFLIHLRRLRRTN